MPSHRAYQTARLPYTLKSTDLLNPHPSLFNGVMGEGAHGNDLRENRAPLRLVILIILSSGSYLSSSSTRRIQLERIFRPPPGLVSILSAAYLT